MIQQQQQKTSQWVLTSVQFNLVEYICSLQSDLIRILNIFVLSNLAEYEYQKIEYSYSNILYLVPIIQIFEYIRVTLFPVLSIDYNMKMGHICGHNGHNHNGMAK